MMQSHDYPACAIYRGGQCTCDAAAEQSEKEGERLDAPSPEHVEHIQWEGSDRVVVRPEEYESLYNAAHKSNSSSVGERLWLWKNFVDGKPEYWAFDNAYPTYAGGDPMTLGSPCGYALVRPSTVGKPHIQDTEVLEEIRRSKPIITEEDFIEIIRQADWRLWGRQLTEEDYKRALNALNFPPAHHPDSGEWQWVRKFDIECLRPILLLHDSPPNGNRVGWNNIAPIKAAIEAMLAAAPKDQQP